MGFFSRFFGSRPPQRPETPTATIRGNDAEIRAFMARHINGAMASASVLEFRKVEDIGGWSKEPWMKIEFKQEGWYVTLTNECGEPGLSCIEQMAKMCPSTAKLVEGEDIDGGVELLRLNMQPANGDSISRCLFYLITKAGGFDTGMGRLGAWTA